MHETISFLLDNQPASGLKLASIGLNTLVSYNDRFYIVEHGSALKNPNGEYGYSKDWYLFRRWKNALEGIQPSDDTFEKCDKNSMPVLKDFMEQVKLLLGDNFCFGGLFGSRARGDARLYSNYDVLIVIKQLDEALRERILDISSELEESFGIEILPGIITLERFDRMKKKGIQYAIEAERDLIPLDCQ